MTVPTRTLPHEAYCHKRATEEIPNFYDAVQAATARVLKQKALAQAGTTALAGLGAGAGLRGLFGLLNMRRDTQVEPETVGAPASEVEIPTHKMANVGKFLSGDYARTVPGIPWAIPAITSAGVVGSYAGWKGIDKLLDAKRRHDLERELEEAKGDYEAALAGTSKLGQDLDELCSVVEKSSAAADVAGKATGLYGVYAGTSGLLGAILAYNYAKKRQKRKLLEDAKSQRRRQQYARQPAVIYAKSTPGKEVPDPLHGSRSPFQAAPSLEEQENPLE